MNMNQWLLDQMAPGKRKAMPVLSFPCTQLLGVTVRELVSDSDLMARGMAEIARRCNTAAAVSFMDLSVEAECFGANIHFTDDEVPTVVGAILGDAMDVSDVEDLEVPEVGAGRTGVCIEAMKKAMELITDRPVFAGVIGPYSLAGRLLDMTNLMVSCYEEPEMVHVVLDKVTQFLTAYIRAFKEAGVPGVVMAEPAAGLIAPDFCSEFSAAYIRKIVDELQDESFIIIYHNCGDAVNKMVPQILSTGAAAYHFGNAVTMEEMLSQIPEDILTMGNVDPVSAFRNGTPEKVREDTLAILEANSGHKNFLISSGCDIPPASPWENIDAFFAAVEEFYNR